MTHVYVCGALQLLGAWESVLKVRKPQQSVKGRLGYQYRDPAVDWFNIWDLWLSVYDSVPIPKKHIDEKNKSCSNTEMSNCIVENQRKVKTDGMNWFNGRWGVSTGTGEECTAMGERRVQTF